MKHLPHKSKELGGIPWIHVKKKIQVQQYTHL